MCYGGPTWPFDKPVPMCEFYNAGACLCDYIIFKQTGAGVCESVRKKIKAPLGHSTNRCQCVSFIAQALLLVFK